MKIPQKELLIHEMKPLVKVQNVFGLSPFSFQGDRVKFSYTSPITLYAFLMTFTPFTLVFLSKDNMPSGIKVRTLLVIPVGGEHVTTAVSALYEIQQ